MWLQTHVQEAGHHCKCWPIRVMSSKEPITSENPFNIHLNVELGKGMSARKPIPYENLLNKHLNIELRLGYNSPMTNKISLPHTTLPTYTLTLATSEEIDL